MSLADILGNFTDFIGGSTQTLPLIRLLENLASAEEPTVRDKAIESLKKVLSNSKVKEHEREFIELIKRFTNDKDTYGLRIVGFSILPTCYPFMSSPAQQELIT